MHRYERWMGEYVDGSLNGRRALALERHVRHCAQCSAALGHARRAGSRERSAVPHPVGPLNAQTLLGTHYSLPQDRESGHRRAGAFVPVVVLLMVFALVGTIAAMSWFLGAPVAQGTPEQDPAESFSTSA